MFDKYPYTDFHELNLDYMLKRLKEMNEEIQAFYEYIDQHFLTSFNGRTGDVVPEAGDYNAAQVTYDNTGSGLAATDVQTAIDEVNAAIPTTLPATDVSYDNTVSGLTATDTQAAIDELAAAPVPDLDDLGDVNITTPANDDVLKYDSNAGEWVNGPGSGGASVLDDLTDVEITTPTNGQVLTYDSNDQKWKNDSASAPSTLGGLSDVTLTTPTDGQALIYDGNSGEWVNGNGGGGSSTLAGLTDVTITTPSDGQVLTYDNNDQEWKNAAIPAQAASVVTYDNSGSGLTATNVQDAIDEIVGASNPGFIQVTADGVKTWADLLHDLYDLIDSTKLSAHTSYIEINEFHYFWMRGNTTMRFETFDMPSDTTYTINKIQLANNAWSYRTMEMNLDGSAGTFTNKSTQVPTSGTTIYLYY